MPIPIGTSVFVLPVRDTGEVTKIHANRSDHDVFRDSSKSVKMHSENDLGTLPYKDRRKEERFLRIIRAYRAGNVRVYVEQVHMIRPDGTFGRKEVVKRLSSKLSGA